MNTQRQFLNDIATNPLLQGIPAPRSHLQWAALLDYNPLRGAANEVLTVDEATQLTENIRDIFVATEQAIKMTAAAHRLLWEGLVQRDPRRYIGSAEFAHLTIEERASMPFKPVDASGMLIMGITQQGKTRFVQRLTKLLPQVMDRGDTVGGMKAMKQLVYLVVPMPTDKSRKGFLNNALMEMDRKLGTDYAAEISDRMPIEVVTERLLAKLADHRCGLLILEESQESNGIVSKNSGSDFAGLFLRILNTGIPMMVVGNPMAFRDLYEMRHSQTLARFSKGGVFMLDPAIHWTAEVWADDLVPAVWGATVFKMPDEVIPDLAERLWKKTGGFRHLLAPLRKRAILLALEIGSDCVTAEIFDEVMEEPIDDAELCDAFAERDYVALSQARDIPWSYFRDEWRDAGYLTGEASVVGAAKEPNGKKPSKKARNPSSRPADAASGSPSPTRSSARGAVEPHEQRMLDFMKQFTQKPGDGAGAMA